MEKRPNIFRRIFNFFRNIFTPITYNGRDETFENILKQRKEKLDNSRSPEEIERLVAGVEDIPFLVQKEKEMIARGVPDKEKPYKQYFKGKNGITVEMIYSLTDDGPTISYHTTDENGVRDSLPVKEAFDTYGPFKLITEEKQNKILDKKGKSERFLRKEFEKFESLSSKYAVVMIDGINISQDENGNLVYSLIKEETIDGKRIINGQKLSKDGIRNQFMTKYQYNNDKIPKPEIFVNRALLKKDLEAKLKDMVTREDGAISVTEVVRINNKAYNRKQIEAALKDDVKFEKIAKEVEKQLRAKPLIPIKLFEKNKNIEINSDVSRKSKREAKVNAKEYAIKNAIHNRDLPEDITKGNYDAVYDKLHSYIPQVAMNEAVLLAATENKNMKLFDKDGKEIKIFVDNDGRKSKVFVDIEYDGQKATYELTPKDSDLSKFKVELTQGEKMEIDFPENEAKALSAVAAKETLENITKSVEFFDTIDDKIEEQGFSVDTVKEICDNLELGQRLVCEVIVDGTKVNISELSRSNKNITYEIEINGNRKTFDLNNERDVASLETFIKESEPQSLESTLEEAEEQAKKENEKIAKNAPKHTQSKEQDQNL